MTENSDSDLYDDILCQDRDKNVSDSVIDINDLYDNIHNPEVAETALNKVEVLFCFHAPLGNDRHLSDHGLGAPVLPLDALLHGGQRGRRHLPLLRLPLELLLDQAVQASRPLSHAADVQGELSLNLMISQRVELKTRLDKPQGQS